jgi:hypothetical protein
MVIVKYKKNSLNDVSVFLNSFNDKNRKEILKLIIDKVRLNKKTFYCGYENKEDLEDFLDWFIFGLEKDAKFSFNFNSNEETIKKICAETFFLCEDFLDDKLSVCIFPTVDKFVIEKMNGCSGFTPKKNNIILVINFVKGWEIFLKQTLIHELSHAISNYYNQGDCTLGEGLILEGIAEHFREYIVGGERSPWTKAITEEEAKKYLLNLKDKLNKKDMQLWRDVFFGSKEYPVWAGYTMGYYLIREYLKKQKEINWKKIIKTNPNKILKEVILNT